MGFTFDSPISIQTTAYTKANRHRSRSSTLPSTKKRQAQTRAPASSSFLSGLTQRVINRNRSSHPTSLPLASSTQAFPPTLALDSTFFRLPLKVRQRIYGYVVGQNEVLHVLMKRTASNLPVPVRHRRCRAGGNIEDCVTESCKDFLDAASGTYFGSFDTVGGLLLTSRDIYTEATFVLYSRNTLDFELPLSLLAFSRSISQQARNMIRSISFEPQRQLYYQKQRSLSQSPTLGANSFGLEQWIQMWDEIARMEGLEEVRVRCRSPLQGWMGRNEVDFLSPLWSVTRPLKVFDVEAPWIAADRFSEIAGVGRQAPFKLLGPKPMIVA